MAYEQLEHLVDPTTKKYPCTHSAHRLGEAAFRQVLQLVTWGVQILHCELLRAYPVTQLVHTVLLEQAAQLLIKLRQREHLPAESTK